VRVAVLHLRVMRQKMAALDAPPAPLAEVTQFFDGEVQRHCSSFPVLAFGAKRQRPDIHTRQA